MSFKTLFKKAAIVKSLANKSAEEIGGQVESVGYHKEDILHEERFIPQVDFSKPENFARFGSAQDYYAQSIERVYEEYPYDGSLRERLVWENESTYIDLYIFDNLYPRRNGYVIFSSDGWYNDDCSPGHVMSSDGYGYPGKDCVEYIYSKGGPHPNPDGMTPYSTQFTGSNYLEASKNRESNLKFDLRNNGSTIEFWLKKKEFYPLLTEKEVVFDLWNNTSITASNYGRVTLEMSASGDDDSGSDPFRLTILSSSDAGKYDSAIGFMTASICSPSFTTSSIATDTWNHYAVSMKNTTGGKSVYFSSGSAAGVDAVSIGSAARWESAIGGAGAAAKAFTISGWIHRSTYTTPIASTYIATLGHESSGYTPTTYIAISFGLSPDASIPALLFSRGGTTDGVIAATTDMTAYANQWVHVACTYDGTDPAGNSAATLAAMKVYINGDVQTTAVQPGGTLNSPTSFAGSNPSLLGARNFPPPWVASTPLHGHLDEVSVWDKALSRREIKEIYNSVVGSTTHGVPSNLNIHSAIDSLLSWYPMGDYYSDKFDATNVKSSRNHVTDIAGNRHGYAYNGAMSASQIAPYSPINNSITTRFYVNGSLEKENQFGTGISTLTGSMGEIESPLLSTIGALITSPSGSSANAYAGKLSGSLDEFRYWKTQRNSKEIGRFWFTQVGGGVNSDPEPFIDTTEDVNTNLGVYYKFNEGILDSSVDANILDYSGRVTNGTWVGRGKNSRSTGSAIVDSGAAIKEFMDPIIYSTHPDVVALKSSLETSGSEYDVNNNASIYNSIPSWITEEDQEGQLQTKYLTQILSSYFDTLHLQMDTLNRFKDINYVSGTNKPLPFAEKMLNSSGFISPEIFLDADVLEVLADRSEDRVYEKSLQDIKNIVYKNIYNNLTYIYKSKGTEKSFRNLIRCFGIDDELIKLNLYATNTIYKYRENRRNVVVSDKSANFNRPGNTRGVVYTYPDSSNAASCGFVTSSTELTGGFASTLEADIFFPRKPKDTDAVYFNTNTLTASLFGVHGASGSARDQIDTVWPETDGVNFQVLAVRDELDSPNAHFVLSGTAGTCLPRLTSSIYQDLYEDTSWNLSVAIKPEGYPYAGFVSGAYTGSTANHIVVFRGFQTDSGEVINSFTVSGSQLGTATVPELATLLTGSKRFFVGAHRTNFTGTVLQTSDVKINSYRYWLDYLDDTALRAHGYDTENHGAHRPSAYAFPFQSSAPYGEISKLDTLVFNWEFSQNTGSNAAGSFLVADESSGSAPSIAATATIVGTAALAGESGTSFILTNTDGSTVTFTTNPTKNFGDTVLQVASPFTINTGGSFASDGIRKATQALWISCKAAIDNGVLDCTIDPTTVAPVASGQEYFTLTQTTAGANGNTAITLITGVTANGETSFTGGVGPPPGKWSWLGPILRRQYTGNAYDFTPSSTSAITKDFIISSKLNPLEVISSIDQVKVLSVQEQQEFSYDSRPVNYFFSFEKSMYRTISDEMLNYFGTLKDFNNIMGEAVDKYRPHYKSMNYVRKKFFEKVSNDEIDFNKFFEFYKWFDSTLSYMLGQLVPVSADFAENIRTVIESHVLERNKYQNKISFLDSEANVFSGTLTSEADYISALSSPEDIGSGLIIWSSQVPTRRVLGLSDTALTKQYKYTHRPVTGLQTENYLYWKNNADYDDPTISVDSSVNSSRRLIRAAIAQTNKRLLDQPYALSGEGERPVIAGSGRPANFDPNVVLASLHPHGPSVGASATAPKNVMQTKDTDVEQLLNTTDVFHPSFKQRLGVDVNPSVNNDSNSALAKRNGMPLLPFSLYDNTSGLTPSPDLSTSFKANVVITNLHNDFVVDASIPLQSPSTERWVGGRHYRHVPLNSFDASKSGPNNLDSLDNRPEGFRIQFANVTSSAGGDLGGNYLALLPPDSIGGAPLSKIPPGHRFRDVTAKRPFMFKHILMTTASVGPMAPRLSGTLMHDRIGTYQKNYEVVHTSGRTTNNLFMRQNPGSIVANPETLATRGRFPLSTETGAGASTPNPGGVLNSTMPDLTGKNSNQTVFVTKFSAGGFETESRGYLNPAGEEYSVYNVIPYRHLLVTNYGLSGSASADPSIENTIHVKGQLGHARGLRQLASLHCGQYGSDAAYGSITDHSTRVDGGLGYCITPSWHKTNRNRKLRMEQLSDGDYFTGSVYDNYYVQHPIPRSPRQYGWITASLAPGQGIWEETFVPSCHPLSASSLPLISSSLTEEVSEDGTDTGNTLPVNFNHLNLYIYEPVTSSCASYTLGYPLTEGLDDYRNTALGRMTTKDLFNSLMLKRNGPTGYATFKQVRLNNNPVVRTLKKENKISVMLPPPVVAETYNGNVIGYTRGKYSNSSLDYIESPVNTRYLPALVISEDPSNVDSGIFKISYGNNLGLFAHESLNNRLGLKISEEKLTNNPLCTTVKYFLSHSITMLVDYGERIYPAEVNAYRSIVRGRTKFSIDNSFPSNTPRLRVQSNVTNSQGEEISSASPWFLDSRDDFATRVPALNIRSGSGEGLNNYSRFGISASNDIIPGALYSYPVGPFRKGLTGQYVFYNGAKWEAGSQADKVPHQDYDIWAHQLRLKAKDYSIVPEFRISEHLTANFLKDPLMDWNLDLTGALYGESTVSNFFETYSNADFMKFFKAVDTKFYTDATKEDKVVPHALTLQCHAAIKFLPYKKFYPIEWMEFCASQFSQSYGSYWEVSGATPRPITDPLFGPGVCFNSYKTGFGIGSSMMVVSSSRTQPPLYDISLRLRADSANNDWPWEGEGFRNYGSSSLLSCSLVPAALDCTPKRVPYEAFYRPEEYLSALAMTGAYIYDNGVGSASLSWSSGGQYVNNRVKWDGQGDELYRLAADNFLVESNRIFTENPAYFISNRQDEFAAKSVKKGDVFCAELSLYRTLSKTGSLTGGPTADRNRFEMYNMGSAFGPPWALDGGTSNTVLRGGVAATASVRITTYSDNAVGHLIKFTGSSGTGYEFRFSSGSTSAVDSTNNVWNVNVGSTNETQRDNLKGAITASNFVLVDFATVNTTKEGANYSVHLTMSVTGTDGNKSITSTLGGASVEGFLGGTVGSGVAKTLFSASCRPNVACNQYGRASVKILATASFDGIPSLDDMLASAEFLYASDYETSIANYDTNAVGYWFAQQISESVDLAELLTTDVPDGFGAQKRWLVRTKKEFPVLNYADVSYTNPPASSPIAPGASTRAVNVGIGHQYGVVPEGGEGQWLVCTTPDLVVSPTLGRVKPRSLAKLVGWEEGIPKRIGTIKNDHTFKEAVVCIPFIQRNNRKKFFTFPRKRKNLKSYQNLLTAMDDFVFPPKFDFTRYKSVRPVYTCVFPFEYKVDQSDLADIWQNLPPGRGNASCELNACPGAIFDMKEVLIEERELVDKLLDTDEDLYWMVFKVKQRAHKNFEKRRLAPVVAAYPDVEDHVSNYPEPIGDISFNWPYDYFSFVELVKINERVRYITQDEVCEDPCPPSPGAVEELVTALKQVIKEEE